DGGWPAPLAPLTAPRRTTAPPPGPLTFTGYRPAGRPSPRAGKTRLCAWIDPMSARPSRYGAIAIVLHWAIAFCIIAMIPMGFWMTGAINEPGAQALAYRVFQFHK